MKGVPRIGKAGGPVTAGRSFMKVGMEHDVRAVLDGPADRFRVSPALMADGNTER
jgi:hypothetical protein